MSEKLPPGTLCVVCDDLATGNHYSVPSCNGCKTFFRRALVNNRQFQCMGNGNCPVNKGVRCACRHCRLQKCLQVGMDKASIQSCRDRIGYTKRTRKADKKAKLGRENRDGSSDGLVRSSSRSPDLFPNDHDRTSPNEFKYDFDTVDPVLERLTCLENNFTLLLSRAEIEPVSSLDDALAQPSRFNQTISIKAADPIARPLSGGDHQPFWRSRIIALYIDWAKTFPAFRNLPHADKIALITNHASSYMIMCEAFRTHEHIDETQLESCMTKSGPSSGAAGNCPSHVMSVVLNDTVAQSFASSLEMKNNVKKESGNEMIRLPTEYGSLPADYGSWIPQDYGRPAAGTEGRSDLHTFFDARSLEHRPSPNTGLRQLQRHEAAGVLSGLTPVMAAMIDYIMKPFRQLNFSTTEFAALQAIMFFDPDTEGIDAASQRNIAAEQKKLLTALHKHILRNYNPTEAGERYSNILLRIPTIRKVAAKKNESLQMIDMLNLYSLNSLVRETALGPRPSNSNTPSTAGMINGDYPNG